MWSVSMIVLMVLKMAIVMETAILFTTTNAKHVNLTYLLQNAPPYFNVQKCPSTDNWTQLDDYFREVIQSSLQYYVLSQYYNTICNTHITASEET